MSISDFRLTREGVCRTFKLSNETLEALERDGVLTPGPDNTFDVAGVAAAIFHFGMSRAVEAERKLGAVGAAIQEVLPALQRLSELPDHAALEGEVRDRVMVELSTFFTAFAGLLSRASATLDRAG